MGRHSRAGGEPAKARRRKTVTRKRPNAPKAGHPVPSPALTKQSSHGSSANGTALEQQRAISEVLRAE
jgi:hypothetical protein